MPMPKKGLRTITVDGNKYRWTMSWDAERPTDGFDDASYFRPTIVVEAIDYPVCRLRAKSNVIAWICAYFWGVAYRWPGAELAGTKCERIVVSPKQVAEAIRIALVSGWTPAVKGPLPCVHQPG